MSDAIKTEIISIGDELLTGHIANSNAAWIADRLLQLGNRVNWITTVGDDVHEIVALLRQAESRAEVIIATGGLGPTHDDLTRTAVCEFFNCRLVLDLEALENIRSFFRHRGIVMARLNEDQARVPDKARLIANDSGTAPGYIFHEQRATFYFLPGVPHEMRSMMQRVIMPEFKQRNRSHLIRLRYLCTIGIAESALYEKIGGIEKLDRDVRVAFLPGFSGVKIRLAIESDDEIEAQARLADAAEYLKRTIAPYVYSEQDLLLEEALARQLSEQGKTLAVAESCTGGLIADKFTDIPGSSRFFERGLVTYSNEAKVRLLGVPAEVIEAFGAVSEQVARAMAEGVRRSANADYGLATTGIAGPTGGEHKPVGLVFVACADEKQTDVQKHTFIGDRRANKERFAYAALNLLRKQIKTTGAS